MKQLLAFYEMADSDNIVVDCFDLKKCEALSIKTEDGDYYIAVDPMKLKSVAGEKYKLAHELGHCETGSFYTRVCLYEIRERLEWKAEKWAIKKLAPKMDLYTLYRCGYTEPWEIAEQMNLPEDFIRKAMAYYHEQELAG